MQAQKVSVVLQYIPNGAVNMDGRKSLETIMKVPGTFRTILLLTKGSDGHLLGSSCESMLSGMLLAPLLCIWRWMLLCLSYQSRQLPD